MDGVRAITVDSKNGPDIIFFFNCRWSFCRVEKFEYNSKYQITNFDSPFLYSAFIIFFTMLKLVYNDVISTLSICYEIGGTFNSITISMGLDRLINYMPDDVSETLLY